MIGAAFRRRGLTPVKVAAGAAPSVVSRNAVGSTTLSFTGHDVGDLLVAVVAHDRSASITASNGFTVLSDQVSGAGTVALDSALIAKIATSNTETTTVGGVSRTRANASWVFRGHSLTDVTNLPYASLASSGNPLDYPTLSGLNAGTNHLVLAVFTVGEGASSNRPSGATSGYGDFQSVTTGTGTTDVAITSSEAAVTGVTSVNPPNQTSNGNWVAWTIAIPGT